MIKAYQATGADIDNGVCVVFADNAKEAKRIAFYYADCCSEDRYIDIRVTRLQECDKHAKGKGIGEWSDFELRKTLVKEYGWYCLERSKKECVVCRLCEEVKE